MTRQLVGSVAILASVFQVRESLTQVFEKTPQLYTQGRSYVYRGNFWWAGASFRGAGSPDCVPLKHVADGVWSLTILDLEDFPEQLEQFASDL